jgi:ATP-binding cassette subfamily C (CFTR/MRP) protein 1
LSYPNLFNAAQHFHLVDLILVLGSDGKIAERGTYDSLNSQTGYIASLLLNSGERIISQGRVKQQNISSKAIKAPTEADMADVTRKTGDMAVYGKLEKLLDEETY